MSDFAVGNFAEVDKDSPKWGTKEGNFLCIAEANANADPALTTLNFYVLASKADAEAVSQYLVKEDKGEPISPAIKRTFDSIIARHLCVPLLKDVKRGWFMALDHDEVAGPTHALTRPFRGGRRPAPRPCRPSRAADGRGGR